MTKQIPIYGRGDKSNTVFGHAIVDDDDFEWLSKYKWFYTDSGYACTNMPRKQTNLMHRMILCLQPKDGFVTDHINRKRDDNRKCNIRKCTQTENTRNNSNIRGGTSKYKGVKRTSSGSWQAVIKVNYQIIVGGSFKDEILAAKRYDQLAREKHGEFASLNFPEIDDYTDVDEYLKVYYQKSSKYRGVTWDKSRQKWQVTLKVIDNNKKKMVFLGRFDDEILAAKVYDKALFENRHLRTQKPVYNFPELINE